MKSQVYSGGCEEAVNEFLETNIDIIGGAKSSFGMRNLCSNNLLILVVALSFGLIEIIGLVLACCLGDRIHRAKHYHRCKDKNIITRGQKYKKTK